MTGRRGRGAEQAVTTSSSRAGSLRRPGSRSSTRRSSRRASAPAAAHCGLKGGGKTDVGLLVCDAPRGQLVAAADPQRLGGGAGPGLPASGSSAAPSGPRWSTPATPTPRRASRAWPTPGDVRGGRARRCGLDPAQVAVAETGVIGVPLPIDAVLAGIGGGRRRALGRGRRRAFAAAILTTDRWPKRCTLRAGGVTVSAQAKGAGMIAARLRDDALLRADRRRRRRPRRRAARRRRRLVRADHRRRADEHQRHRAAAGDRRGGRAAARRACSTRSCCSSRSRSSPTARARRGSARIAGRRAPPRAAEAERVARAIANSPLVKTALFGRDPNWGRIAQAAGMALAGEELEEIGADGDRRRRAGRGGRRGRDRAAARPRRRMPPTSTSPTSATSTSGSTRSTRREDA